MTQGRLPAVAIKKAITIAAGRGIVLERDLFERSCLGFILICPGCTTFVKIRRTRCRLACTEDCAAHYRRDILYLRQIPLTAVVTRELWLFSPWGTWQYFRILDDRIIEIRNTGGPVLQQGPNVTVPVSGEGDRTGKSAVLVGVAPGGTSMILISDEGRPHLP
jgi:hypothetical protein